MEETKQMMPALSASTSDKTNWLLTENWKCYVGGTSYDMSNCHNVNDAEPVFKLHQSGFFSWINERGMQCINHITGVFTQVKDNSSGGYTYQPPSATSSGTSPHECWQECMYVTREKSATEPCVNCIMLQLSSKPSLCVPSITREMMTDTIECQMMLIPELLTEEAEIDFPQVWHILQTDSLKSGGLDTTTLILIIVFSIVGALITYILFDRYWFHASLATLSKKDS